MSDKFAIGIILLCFGFTFFALGIGPNELGEIINYDGYQEDYFFEPENKYEGNYTLIISKNGKGTLSQSVGEYEYPCKTPIKITAFPDEGWSFDYWSGDKYSSETSMEFTLESNCSITANFQWIERELSLDDIENYVFHMTNDERNKKGLYDLNLNSGLSIIAKQHSIDMADNNYFSHINQQGEDATDRAKNYGISIKKEKNGLIWTGIGENIEKMPTGHVVGALYSTYVYTELDIATYTLIDWMNSEGHRANILSDVYDDIGVGVAYDGEKYYYITQTFK